MTLVLPSALLLMMVAIEAFILRLIQGKEVPWNQIVFNLNSGHTILWVFRGLEVAVFHAVYERFSLGWVAEWSHVAQFALALLFWDFCFYWLHRMHHKLGCSGPCTWCITKAITSVFPWAFATAGTAP